MAHTRLSGLLLLSTFTACGGGSAGAGDSGTDGGTSSEAPTTAAQTSETSDETSDSGTETTSTETTGTESCGVSTPWSRNDTGPFVVSYEPNGAYHPSRPRPSADGRYILFTQTSASGLTLHLVDNDCGALEELPLAGMDPMALVSELDDLELSADGSTVVFNKRDPSTNGRPIFALDVASGELERLDVLPDGTPSQGLSDHPSISADGRFVAFSSDAPLTSDDDGSGITDIFVRDRVQGVTELISIATDGRKSSNHCYGPTISADGRFVAFEAFASSLSPEYWSNGTHVYVRDRQQGILELASPQPPELPNGTSTGWRPYLSANGRHVAFATDYAHLPADDNDELDIYVLDRDTDTLAWVSNVAPAELGELQHDAPMVTADGQRLVYLGIGTNPAEMHALVHDRATGTTIKPEPGPTGHLLDLKISDLRLSDDGAWLVAVTTTTDSVAPPLPPGTSAIVMRRVDPLF